jgi:ribosomal protein L11 methyltransferase
LSAGAWTTVRVHDPKDRAAVVAALFKAGAEGVQELDDEIVTHLRQPDEQGLNAAIRIADRSARIAFAPTPDIDWSAQWRSRISAHRVGVLVVTPPWLADDYSESERVVIEPEMAFGTGEHETTRGVLRILSRQPVSGMTVADLGAGSAVLAIGAAKLGATRVAAIELDPDAIGNAESNVAINNVADRVAVLEGDARTLLPLLAPVDVVLANIISSVLLELLPAIGEALDSGGFAILSGILAEERSSILSALAAAGWHTIDEDAEGLWWSVAIAR